MLILDSHISELCALHRTGLKYLSFDPLRAEHLNELPALRIYQVQKSTNTKLGYKSFNLTLHAFYPYPLGCNTFDEAKEASKNYADELSLTIKELIRTGLVQYKGYQIAGDLTEIVFNGQAVTEHKVIAIQLQVTVQCVESFTCCMDGTYFDFTGLQTANTWKS